MVLVFQRKINLPANPLNRNPLTSNSLTATCRLYLPLKTHSVLFTPPKQLAITTLKFESSDHCLCTYSAHVKWHSICTGSKLRRSADRTYGDFVLEILNETSQPPIKQSKIANEKLLHTYQHDLETRKFLCVSMEICSVSSGPCPVSVQAFGVTVIYSRITDQQVLVCSSCR